MMIILTAGHTMRLHRTNQSHCCYEDYHLGHCLICCDTYDTTVLYSSSRLGPHGVIRQVVSLYSLPFDFLHFFPQVTAPINNQLSHTFGVKRGEGSVNTQSATDS